MFSPVCHRETIRAWRREALLEWFLWPSKCVYLIFLLLWKKVKSNFNIIFMESVLICFWTWKRLKSFLFRGKVIPGNDTKSILEPGHSEVTLDWRYLAAIRLLCCPSSAWALINPLCILTLLQVNEHSQALFGAWEMWTHRWQWLMQDHTVRTGLGD